MHRRSFLAGSAGVISAPFLPRRAFAQDLVPLAVQFGWIANVEYGDHWVALDQGLFQQRGLDVTAVSGGPNAPDPMTMLAAGKAQVGYGSWLPFLDAVAHGNDFVVIAARFQSSPLGIISLAAAPILSAEDIPGKRILLQGPAEQTAIDATLGLGKISGDWTAVPAGFSPEPLVAGEGDGYTAFATNQTITLEGMGLVRDQDFFFRSFDELGFRSYAGIAIVSREYLDANREALAGYLASLMQAWRAMKEDPELPAQLAVNEYGADFGLDIAQQRRQSELQLDFVFPGGDPGYPILSLDPELMAGPMMAAARATGRDNLPDISTIADPSLVEEAAALL
jgi:ABC-type nitrate/sulfonate/bicarbonate transport system substrate-binding protein